MEVDIKAVPLAEPEHQVTRDPELVSGALGALAEDLEFPLSLRDFGVEALPRESERRPVLVEEVLLLEAEPGVGVVCDRGAAVRRVWGSVREKHLTHDEASVVARRIGK